MTLTTTVEKVLPSAAVQVVYPMYAAAFEPMGTLMAGRHLLSAAEFAEEMADERIDKYVVWDNDTPAGLGTMATDLRAVPWISPEFYLTRFPEHAARGALFYLGFTVVDPAYERRGILAMITDALYRRCTEARAVGAVDMSEYSSNNRVGRVLTALRAAPGVSVEELDRQTYQTIDFSHGAPVTQTVDVQTFYAVNFDGLSTAPEVPTAAKPARLTT